jgi:polyferredoxin
MWLMSVRPLWWIGVFFAAIGGCTLGLYWLAFAVGQDVEGVVVAEEVVHDTGADSRTRSDSRFAVVEFMEPHTANLVRRRLSLPDSPWHHTVPGERRSMKYWALPGLLLVRSFSDTWLLPLIIFLAGLLMIGVYFFTKSLLAGIEGQICGEEQATREVSKWSGY